MPALQDITGQRFGRLTVIEREPAVRRRTMWKCRCRCGHTCTVGAAHLKSGHTQSCGCLLTETIHQGKTHGLTCGGKSPIYKIWQDMKRRCNNPRNRSYAFYGGRGIKVCERWSNFAAFHADMGERPSPKHSLDRIDNNRGYEPGNVRWATRKEQRGNQRMHRTARPIEAHGKILTLSEWAQYLNIDKTKIAWRLKHGWPPEKALTP